jgi:hypothetical protein
LGKSEKSELGKEKCKKITKFNKLSKEKRQSFPNPVSEII